MRRIVVIGTSCSGKTTLARELSRRLNLPYVELDALHWGPNWTPREGFAERVEQAIANDAWVIDGNYSAVRRKIWAAADTIVWLDYPLRIVLSRGLRRSIVRAWNQTELWHGNRESFRLTFLDKESILLWLLKSWRQHRRDYPKLLRSKEFAAKRIIRMRHPQETAKWIDQLPFCPIADAI
jgi:adenylate kinase family enzyme